MLQLLLIDKRKLRTVQNKMGFSEREAKVHYVESDEIIRLPYPERAAPHFPPSPNEALSKGFLDKGDALKNQLFSLRLWRHITICSHVGY